MVVDNAILRASAPESKMGSRPKNGGPIPDVRGLLSSAATPLRSDEREGRIKAWQALDLPAGINRQVHQNRLLKIARGSGQMLSGK